MVSKWLQSQLVKLQIEVLILLEVILEVAKRVLLEVTPVEVHLQEVHQIKEPLTKIQRLMRSKGRQREQKLQLHQRIFVRYILLSFLL